MLKSMTAYGRSKKVGPSGVWLVEIHSVNRKTLDISMSLPPELLFLDLDVREWIQKEVGRGQLTVRVKFEPAHLHSSTTHLKELKKKWESLARELGYGKEVIGFDFLMERTEVIFAEESLLRKDLKEAVHQALSDFVKMRVAEGKTLVTDIKKRLDRIIKELKKIEKKLPTVAVKYREKLQEKLHGLGDERLLREVVLYAEKVDLTEEITRLKSHLDQFKGFLAGKEGVVGRTLDFLAQEMGREIHTIMAKAADNDIASVTVMIKGEIEKIREQVQNIE